MIVCTTSALLANNHHLKFSARVSMHHIQYSKPCAASCARNNAQACRNEGVDTNPTAARRAGATCAPRVRADTGSSDAGGSGGGRLRSSSIGTRGATTVHPAATPRSSLAMGSCGLGSAGGLCRSSGGRALAPVDMVASPCTSTTCTHHTAACLGAAEAGVPRCARPPHRVSHPAAASVPPAPAGPPLPARPPHWAPQPRRGGCTRPVVPHRWLLHRRLLQLW